MMSARYSMVVFSAHAEVVPRAAANDVAEVSILRARGGSSGVEHATAADDVYSPRTRR